MNAIEITRKQRVWAATKAVARTTAVPFASTFSKVHNVYEDKKGDAMFAAANKAFEKQYTQDCPFCATEPSRCKYHKALYTYHIRGLEYGELWDEACNVVRMALGSVVETPDENVVRAQAINLLTRDNVEMSDIKTARKNSYKPQEA